jgi:hypothetical protein
MMVLQRFFLAHADGDRRFVLRLWSSNTIIAGDNHPLFIGTVEQQCRRNLAGLITLVRVSGEYDRSLNVMEQIHGDGLNMKRVYRMDHEMQGEHEPYWLRWRGEVLLVWEKDKR